MKKILIGTHNKGKFKEIAYLISKKYKKISPLTLKIKSPRETGKTFSSNSKLKVKFFSKFANYPVISDDSGLCIKALRNKPGIQSARFAKEITATPKPRREKPIAYKRFTEFDKCSSHPQILPPKNAIIMLP